MVALDRLDHLFGHRCGTSGAPDILAGEGLVPRVAGAKIEPRRRSERHTGKGNAAKAELPEESVDRILVERAQRGDREAFAQLALSASDRLFGVALRLLRDVDAAGDALQAALVKIWHDLPGLRDPDRFDGWSYRVLLRQCQTELRARRRRSDVDLRGTDAPIGDAQIDVALRDELERAFSRLSADQRAVLVLMYYRDLSVSEIAEILDVSVGTVKSRLHYARSAMRAAIEADARPVPQEGRPA